jgi:replication factor A1
MRGITVKGKMVKIPPARLVLTRWGSSASVSNVTVADDTGSIRLGLWNGQIKTAHVGDEVEVNNSSVTRFAGELHLKLGRKSTISVIH